MLCRSPRPCLLIFSAAFFLGGLPPPVRADLRLVFDLVQQKDTPATQMPKKDATHTERKSTLTVVLGEDTFSSADDETATFVDFAQKRFHLLKLREKSYHEIPLFSDIGFRDAEFRNRLMLQKGFEAAKIKDNPFDIVLSEQLFSLRAPGSAPLTPAGKTDALVYVRGEKPLFSGSSKGTTVSNQEAKHFGRFLRYTFALHPDILAALEKRRLIPAEFDIYHYNMTTDRVHLTLVKTETVPPAFDPAKAAEGLKHSDGEVASICALAGAITPQEFQKKCAELNHLAVQESQAGRQLDAMLLFLETTLSNSEPLPKEFVALKSAIQADPAVQTFLGQGKPREKAAAQKAADVMHSLQAQAQKGVVVLKIHEANYLTAAGKTVEARRLFREVLSESPWIVGAWKDLGDLYYGQYEMTTAWQCWDAGRRILPTQRQFKPVDELEHKLITLYPEFF